MTNKRIARRWPSEDYGLYEVYENVINAICDRCPVCSVESDTGACVCPVDLDCASSGCYTYPTASEVYDFFLFQVLPFLQDTVKAH